MPGMQVAPDTQFTFTYNATISTTNMLTTNGVIGRTTILMPVISGSLTSSISVQVNNSRWFINAPVSPSQAIITVGDKVNTFDQLQAKANIPDSSFSSNWVDITNTTFVHIANGVITIDYPFRFIRLAGGSASALTGSNYAFMFHDNISVGY